MSKNAGWILHGGVHSVHIGVQSVVTLRHRGRPEPESGTPVNMENRLHRDNGEGVAATPPPYPLVPRRRQCQKGVNELFRGDSGRAGLSEDVTDGGQKLDGQAVEWLRVFG